MSHRTSFTSVKELVPGDGPLTATFKTSMGDFSAVLHEDISPNTVSSFVGLATGKSEWIDPKTGTAGSGRYYDGVIFHRVISGFMLQGGDRTGTGRGGPGYTFDNECSPDAKHTKAGILSMANAGNRGNQGTNGSQFFVTLGPTPHLNGKHTVFGEVTVGLDIVNTIGKTKTARGDRPLQDVVINTIEISRG